MVPITAMHNLNPTDIAIDVTTPDTEDIYWLENVNYWSTDSTLQYTSMGSEYRLKYTIT